MATTAQSLIDKAALLLNDVGNVRTTSVEMLAWLSDGQREVVILNPDLYQSAAAYTLAAGAMQTITTVTDFFQLLRVSRNLAADGVTPGRVVTVTSADLLDRFDPDWHNGTKAAAVKHYTYDARRPGNFQVYPPAVAGTKVELVYSATPQDVDALTDNIVLPDLIGPALVDYLCFRALTKDAEFADLTEKATGHYALFKAAVANISNNRLTRNPNLEPGTFNPGNPTEAR